MGDTGPPPPPPPISYISKLIAEYLQPTLIWFFEGKEIQVMDPWGGWLFNTQIRCSMMQHSSQRKLIV
jgi:hypothetical protein